MVVVSGMRHLPCFVGMSTPCDNVACLNVFLLIVHFNPILEIKFQNLMIYTSHSVARRLSSRPVPSVQSHSIAAVKLDKGEFFFGTALVLSDRELRITRRCLRDDLEGSAKDTLENQANHPIVKAFVRERRQKLVGSSFVEPLESGKEISVLRHQHEHRGATWHDKQNDVIWLVAYGRHESGQPGDFFPYCKGLDQADVLLPTAADYDSLFRERDLRLARRLVVDPPLLLKRARESRKEERAQIGGQFGTAVAVEFADDLEAISVAFDTRSESFYATLPVILAAFVPGVSYEDWDSLDRMPRRDLEESEVAFSYVGEIP